MKSPDQAPAVALSPSFIHHRRLAYWSSLLRIRKRRLFIWKGLVLNSTTKAWIAAGIGILFSVGIIFWQVRASHAAPVNLSADDMSLIASDQAPQMRMRLSSDDNARREF